MVDRRLREGLLAQLIRNAETWALRIESDPKVQAFRIAKAKAELEGSREPIEDFARRLKRAHTIGRPHPDEVL
jgi:hypothetical protein